MSINISDDARKILSYFKARRLRQGNYLYPTAMEDLFDRSERCEMAQSELASLGLLDLASAHSTYRSTKVRSAALSYDGARLLETSSVNE